MNLRGTQDQPALSWTKSGGSFGHKFFERYILDAVRQRFLK